jgi:hypothetical protein
MFNALNEKVENITMTNSESDSVVPFFATA